MLHFRCLLLVAAIELLDVVFEAKCLRMTLIRFVFAG